MNTAYRIPRKRATKRRKRPHVLNLPKRVRDSRFMDPRSYVTKGGRVRLFGDDMTNLRLEVYQRAQGMCQAAEHHEDCAGRIYFLEGHLAHLQHGPWKTDTKDGTEWRSAVCHMIQQHNPKPCPKKAERMSA